MFSSALADLLLTQTPDFAGLADPATGRLLRVNPAGVQLLGYSSEAELLALPTPPLPPEWPALLAEARRNGTAEATVQLGRPGAPGFAARLVLQHVVPHDPAAPLLLQLQPVRPAGCSQPERLHRAEQALAQSHGRFEAVVSHATIGIIVCNRAGAIISANRMAHQQFGYPPEGLPGIGIDALVPMAPGRNHQRLRESFNADPQVRSMSAHRGDLEGQRADGSVFPVEVSLSYFHLEDELHVVSYILDVTEKRQARQALVAERLSVERLNADLEQKVADRTHALLSTLEQLEQRKDELAKALAAEQELGELKSRFVSMASHEFRTPLTAVLTSASLIEQYPAAEQQPKRLRHLERIRQSVNHLNDILEEFLSVGRIEEGRVVARAARLHLPTLVEGTMLDVQGLHKPGQRIEPDLSACPHDIWLDTSLLRKILVNLLSNALKYSGEETVVRLHASCAGNWLTLRIEDEGVGISEEDQQHLFERFFRARSVSNLPGTGLGLYIVGRYAELMGGTVDLESQLGRGTTVTLIIPYENHSAD
ncbi:sensor histidine kinase [Hymenobacter lapidiphilus]|uniref:histidine kinase n=1 Tax=Hymenobacter lapidiphilus TaxID=2608003 RepID=A0A7Y7PQ06_9BACT|nr:PAS domain-containing sensor histidine kinase [Hymenobacter lapidiphilus]NVO31929.1 PAS domain-containing sensor histidine kinase [Hymenobacter lapidiphilus]